MSQDKRKQFADVLNRVATQALVRGVHPKTMQQLIEEAGQFRIYHKGRVVTASHDPRVQIERRGSALVVCIGGDAVPYKDSQVQQACEHVATAIYGNQEELTQT
jgi:NCAIR mutase (PurE)-related protein